MLLGVSAADAASVFAEKTRLSTCAWSRVARNIAGGVNVVPLGYKHRPFRISRSWKLPLIELTPLVTEKICRKDTKLNEANVAIVEA